jgi:uncharacterized phage protein gp47/JayE
VSNFGVTSDGFIIRALTDILQDKASRAQDMFGSDVDLRSTSSIRKLLDITSAEDQEIWKLAESQFYSNFLSTANGQSLDLLGDDLAVPRRFLQATGTVALKLSGGAPGRVYNFPTGTLVETGAPAVRFRTVELARLSSSQPQQSVSVEAVARGIAGNVAKSSITTLNANYAAQNLNLGGATVSVQNDSPTSGGDLSEDDETYRARLLGRPRTLWTLDAVAAVVKDLDGVRDARLFDPSGGVDVSLSKFNLFAFNSRKFGVQRSLGSPYFFDVLVAVEPGYLWETGLHPAVDAAIAEVRPIGIFPNIRPANNVFIGVRADVSIKAGHDATAVAASLKGALDQRVNKLGLGGSVLLSEIVHDFMDVAGVVDVQQPHLRRCPSIMGTVTFGSTPRFQAQIIEAEAGENIDLQPDEIATFQVDSPLTDLRISDR